MKNEYKNINVLISNNNINIQQEKIKNIISFLESQYEFDLDYSKWKCGTKDKFIEKINDLKNLLSNLNKKMDVSKETLNIIKKIQELSKQIEELESENEMLKNSLSQSDKFKIIQNNNIIEGNREYIEQLKANITVIGW